MDAEEGVLTMQIVVCENCQNRLDLHQPDTETTERLLGTCDVCHSWFTVDVGPGNHLHTNPIGQRGPIEEKV